MESDSKRQHSLSSDTIYLVYEVYQQNYILLNKKDLDINMKNIKR